jgi:hypothetical protein
MYLHQNIGQDTRREPPQGEATLLKDPNMTVIQVLPRWVIRGPGTGTYAYPHTHSDAEADAYTTATPDTGAASTFDTSHLCDGITKR